MFKPRPISSESTLRGGCTECLSRFGKIMLKAVSRLSATSTSNPRCYQGFNHFGPSRVLSWINRFFLVPGILLTLLLSLKTKQSELKFPKLNLVRDKHNPIKLRNSISEVDKLVFENTSDSYSLSDAYRELNHKAVLPEALSRLHGQKHEFKSSLDSNPELDLERIKNSGCLGNGTVQPILDDVNRFHMPWFVPRNNYRLKTRKEARNRIIYSPSSGAAGDGLGHAMASKNFLVRAAHILDLALSHTEEYYSSLTMSDKYAVDKFFGWTDGVEVRRSDLQEHVCIPPGGPGKQWDDSSANGQHKCNTCTGILPGNKYGIKKLVVIPETVVDDCMKIGILNSAKKAKCEQSLTRFLQKNKEPNTLFSISDHMCNFRRSSNIFGDTKHFYWHKYWAKHGIWPAQNLAQIHKKKILFRELKLQEHQLTVAVHVRRGDFIEMKQVRARRKVLPDAGYAELINQALIVVNLEGGIFSNMPIAVHIYSEGKVLAKQGPLSHNIEEQDRKYYDSGGTARDSNWWIRLIEATAKRHVRREGKSKERCIFCWRNRQEIDNMMKRLNVSLRISEHTLTSLDEMISADIFIGSVSGMSTNIVWSLTRGVSMLPVGMPVNSEGQVPGGYEHICCTVSFDTTTFKIRADKLFSYWHEYSEANKDSAARAVKRNAQQKQLRM